MIQQFEIPIPMTIKIVELGNEDLSLPEGIVLELKDINDLIEIVDNQVLYLWKDKLYLMPNEPRGQVLCASGYKKWTKELAKALEKYKNRLEQEQKKEVSKEEPSPTP